LFLKEKKEKRSASSIQAEASAWIGEDPFPICFLVPVKASASSPQILKKTGISSLPLSIRLTSLRIWISRACNLSLKRATVSSGRMALS